METDGRLPGPIRASGVVIDAAFITSPESLVVGLRLGRVAARATLIQRYASFVEQLLLRIFNWDPTLPECVEQVFVRAFESAEKLDASATSERTIETWLLEHTVRVALRRLRWRRLFPAKEYAAPLPGLSHASSNELAKVYRVLGRLAPAQRIAFCLVYVAELDPEEVARALDISVTSLERQLSRALDYVERFTTQGEEPAKPRFRAA